MINPMLIGGYRIVTPRPDKKYYKYEWYDCLMTFIKMPYISVDPLWSILETPQSVIKDDVNKVFYMHESAAREVISQMRRI